MKEVGVRAYKMLGEDVSSQSNLHLIERQEKNVHVS
jgi:hypothetical protein